MHALFHGGIHFSLIFLVVWVTAFLPFSTYSDRSVLNPPKQVDFALESPITATLQIDPVPLIGQSADLTCTVTSSQDAPATQMEIILPPDAVVDNGSLQWTGDLIAGSVYSHTIRVSFTAEGNHEVTCKVLHIVSESESWGEWPALYFTIGKTTSMLGYASVSPQNGVVQAKMATRGEGQVIATTPMTFPSVNPTDSDLIQDSDKTDETHRQGDVQAAGALTITGQFHYYDRADQWTGTTGMLVRVFRGDNGVDLAYCYADGNGAYTCGPFTNPGAVGVRACVMSFASYAPNPDILAVVNPAWGTDPAFDHVYTICTNTQTFADGTRDIGSWFVGNGVAVEQAFWMERDLIDAWGFVWTYGSSLQGTPVTPGPSTLEWQDGLAPPPGSGDAYYTTHGNIHIFGTQPNSVSVVHHEYGHNIMHNTYGVDYDDQREACTGTHTYQAAGNDGCAWNEGWATFIDLAVRNDSSYRWASGSTLDLEPPTWGSTNWPNNGPTVIGRVTGALWDMYDAVNDGADEYYYSFFSMWNTYTWFSAHNISNFYANWAVNGYPSLGAAMAIYHNTIDVRLDPPGSFSKSSPADFATGQPSTVTLSWTASSGATSYAYCFDTSDDNTCNSSWISVGTNLSANITLPSPATTYYWHVRSVKGSSHTYAGGNDTYFREFTTEPFPGPFDRLTPSNGATNQNASVTLDWANSSDADSYSYCLWKSSDPGCGGWTSTGSSSTVTLSSLQPNTQYRWSARSTNTFGTRDVSGAYWSFTTHASGPTVLSITRSSTVGPPRPSSVTFLVTFSETVSGTASADFSITTSGIAGASVTNVTGSGATRTVTVGTGTGNGTLRLNVPAGATIADSYGFNISGLPFTNGETYFITDKFIFLPLLVR